MYTWSVTSLVYKKSHTNWRPTTKDTRKHKDKITIKLCKPRYSRYKLYKSQEFQLRSWGLANATSLYWKFCNMSDILINDSLQIQFVWLIHQVWSKKITTSPDWSLKTRPSLQVVPFSWCHNFVIKMLLP